MLAGVCDWGRSGSPWLRRASNVALVKFVGLTGAGAAISTGSDGQAHQAPSLHMSSIVQTLAYDWQSAFAL